MDLSDHTECCGSECKPFHLGSCFNSSFCFTLASCSPSGLVKNIHLHCELSHCTLPDSSMLLHTSMYVKAYLDLWSKSPLCCVVASWPVHLGAWPGGSWLPWRAMPVLFCLFWLRLL